MFEKGGGGRFRDPGAGKGNFQRQVVSGTAAVGDGELS